MELTVDTTVFVDSEKIANAELLISLKNSHKIVLDSEGEIFAQYRRNVLEPKKDSLGARILKHFMKNKGFQLYSGTPSSAVHTCLNSMPSFHNDDHVFVAVSERSTDKHLIVEESDYTQEVQSRLREDLGLAVYSPSEFVSIVE